MRLLKPIAVVAVSLGVSATTPQAAPSREVLICKNVLVVTDSLSSSEVYAFPLRFDFVDRLGEAVSEPDIFDIANAYIVSGHLGVVLTPNDISTVRHKTCLGDRPEVKIIRLTPSTFSLKLSGMDGKLLWKRPLSGGSAKHVALQFTVSKNNTGREGYFVTAYSKIIWNINEQIMFRIIMIDWRRIYNKLVESVLHYDDNSYSDTVMMDFLYSIFEKKDASINILGDQNDSENFKSIYAQKLILYLSGEMKKKLFYRVNIDKSNKFKHFPSVKGYYYKILKYENINFDSFESKFNYSWSQIINHEHSFSNEIRIKFP